MNTKAGGQKAQQTLRERMTKEELHAWRVKIGRKGGLKSKGGGFASDKRGKDGLTGYERARIAGAKGGSVKRVNKKGDK